MRCLPMLCVLAAAAYAQEFRATLTGRVIDSTGAAVPGAVVQVRNTATNEVATAVSDAQGIYAVPLLRPGAYNLSTQVAGFKAYTREGLTLNIGQTAAVDITLEVGAVTEQVTVTGEAPLLETTTADRGGVIDSQGVREFPLNARNPFMLSMLIAGVNFNGAQIYQRPFDNGAIADWSINGSQNRQNEFLLDGAPNNAQAGGNNIALVPPVDAVQEFKIQTIPTTPSTGTPGAASSMSRSRAEAIPSTGRPTSSRAATAGTPTPSRTTPAAPSAPAITWTSTASRWRGRSICRGSTTAGTGPSSWSTMRATARARPGR